MNEKQNLRRKDVQTSWKRLPEGEPIALRDPLAEVLGMVEEGDPIYITFPDVAKAAGHACPAVSGAYRSTQLALDELYPDSLPVRSEIEVVVGGEPGEPGLGPMSHVISHITGAARDTGFSGFGGYGGRDEMLSFGEVPGKGRSFEFTRTDNDETVRVMFDPSATGVSPSKNQGNPMEAIPKIIRGEIDERGKKEFYDRWHKRVQKILDSDPRPESPFSLEKL